VGADVGSEDADGFDRVVRDWPSVASGDAMMQIKRFIVAAVGGLAVGAAVQASVMPWTVKAMRWQASTSTVTAVVTPAVTNDFTIRFLTGTFPTNLTVGLTPSVTNAALYDPGDGVWRVYSARTITLASGSKYISFRGAWTNSSRTYQALFSGTFNTTAYTCLTEGAFSNTPVTASAYRDMFLNARAIVSFTTNPIPLLTGAPGADMFRSAFQGMTGLTNIPVDFLNTSGLTGAPAAGMLYNACRDISGVKTLPVDFMNTSSLTGAPTLNMANGACFSMSGVTNLPANFLNFSGLNGPPAANMCYQSCRGMSGVKTLPANFLNTSKLTGAPASLMFYQVFLNMSGVTNLPANCLDMSGLSGPPAAGMLEYACNGMTGLVAGDFNISSNVTFATTNITSSMSYAFGSMTKWTGTVYWGTNRIYDAITNPATRAYVFQNSTNVPGYTTMGSNWK
jgi:hypothetical protein